MPRIKTICVVFFLALIFIFAQPNIFACSCSKKPTVLDSFEGADLVVLTKVVSVEKLGKKQGEYDIHYIRSTKMVAEKVYKGKVKVGDELTFAQGSGGDCTWRFDEKDIGKEYLFYFDQPTKRRWIYDEEDEDKKGELMYHARICDRSIALEHATDDLLYLDKLDKVLGKTRISGTLNSWTSDAPSFENIKIKIIGKNKTYETKTDKNGVYEICDLPSGEYLIEPQIPTGWRINEFMLGYASSYPGGYESKLKVKNQVPIILEEKKHAGLDLVFKIDSAKE